MNCDEAVVLVGGLGTRLKPVVSDVPKPLAPVAGRPFLAWVLDELANAGMRRIILATGFGAGQVEAAIGDQWGALEIVYSHEPKPLGTGGAIRHAIRMLKGRQVHVLNGDTFLEYSPQRLQQVTEAEGASIGVALAHVDDVGRYGAVEISNGRVTGFREKGGSGSGLINAGTYFLSACALDALPVQDVFSFEHDVLIPAASHGRVAAFTDTAAFIDIGVPDDYFAAQSRFRAS